jgi:hypothetical protein
VGIQLESLRLSNEKVEIGSLIVLSRPYTKIGQTISAEATVKGLRRNGGLSLEFWVETPSGKNEKQATNDIKDLPVGEESRYTAEFTSKETGFYTIYAYLYDRYLRIGHKTAYQCSETIAMIKPTWKFPSLPIFAKKGSGLDNYHLWLALKYW